MGKKLLICKMRGQLHFYLEVAKLVSVIHVTGFGGIKKEWKSQGIMDPSSVVLENP